MLQEELGKNLDCRIWAVPRSGWVNSPCRCLGGIQLLGKEAHGVTHLGSPSLRGVEPGCLIYTQVNLFYFFKNIFTVLEVRGTDREREGWEKQENQKFNFYCIFGEEKKKKNVMFFNRFFMFSSARWGGTHRGNV